ncbi:MAG TPA: RsmB/NOP family class I SAM-dependent RNA methyltransferase [Candidatus Dormibacteraeota bacterium]|nr:RsmB/NOP family class I SAM-dependent RNA methyltransferase [Candidatus Dormibacteraeota bacterium]
MSPVSDPDLTTTLKLASKALLSTTRGASEREAILEAALMDPRLTAFKREALALVISVLHEQDSLDMIIRQAVPNGTLRINTLCILRLVAFKARLCKNRDDLRRLERSIRAVAQIDDLSIIESLLGVAISWNEQLQTSQLPEFDRIGLETHHSPWWVGYCARVFGRANAIRLLSSPPRPRYIRVNTLRNRGRATLPLVAKGLASSLIPVPGTRGVYRLRGSPSAFSDFFSQGLFQMQDLASYLAVRAGDPKPGESVLDLCAAPGGKTAAVAQFMRNRGRIVSVDYSNKRMATWKREIKRLGVKIAEPVIGDATRLDVHTKFDLVIIDPPCTGTGVFDRNPSMKWHLSAKSLSHYATLQANILESASQFVDDDGRILYCTCSVTIEENEDLIRAFVKSHPDFEPRPIIDGYGSPGLQGASNCRRFYPHRDNCAGYFVALLQRVY